MHQAVLVEDLAVVLCIAGIVAILFQKIKQPTVLGYLIAGIIIGPYTPPFSLIDDESEIRLLAELGVIFLMFSLGLEFTFNKLTRLGLPALIIGVFEVVTMVLIGFAVGEFLGWSAYESLLLGSALSISSTTIIIKALEDFNLKKFSFAELMVGVLLIEDIMAILLLVYVSTSGDGNSNSIFSNQILYTSLKLLLAITSWFLIGYFVLPYIMRKIQNYINHETLTIISVGLCLFLSSVAVYFNYSAALGAFVMGAIMAETPLAQKIETLTMPIRDIFAAVFFVSVGMLINPADIVKHWPLIFLFSFITIFGKILTSGLGALLAGQNMSNAIRIGFSMAQIGEFSFIIMGLGSTVRTTDESLYPIIVAIAAVTTFATPYLIKFSMKISDKALGVMPKRWQFILHQYEAWFNRPSEKSNQEGRGKSVIRLLINGIIVAVIASISAQVIIPHLFPAVNKEWPFQFLFWSVISLLASPFIWAMLFASASDFMQQSKAAKFLPLLFTGAELALLAWLYFTIPFLILPLTLFLGIYFKLFFHFIRKIYFWLENTLIHNLSRKFEIDEEVLRKLAPWEHELVQVKVSSQFPFIGQSLQESSLRPAFGINIVAIKRALKTIWLPNPHERILPEDELIILGEKDEIDYFRDFAQRIKEESHSEQPELQIHSMKIGPGHVLIHHLISTAIVQQSIHGLIVGLDRAGQHILNPSPDTILKEGDTLLYIRKKEEQK